MIKGGPPGFVSRAERSLLALTDAGVALAPAPAPASLPDPGRLGPGLALHGSASTSTVGDTLVGTSSTLAPVGVPWILRRGPFKVAGVGTGFWSLLEVLLSFHRVRESQVSSRNQDTAW